MADVSNDLSTANGWFKDQFGEIVDARPNMSNQFINEVGFEESHKLGEKLSEVVWLTEEAGFTYDSGAGTAFALLDSVAAVSKELTGSGAEIVLRTTVSYKALSAAVASEAAFGRTYKRLIANMTRSFHKRLEITNLWGGTNLGIIDATSIVDAGVLQTFEITRESWATGLWAGMENAKLDAFDITLATKRNATAPIIIKSVTPPTGGALGKMIFSGVETELDAIIGTDVLFWEGAQGNEQTGLFESASNSGTYLGIDGSSSGFSQWAGNSVAVGGIDLTWDKVEDGVSLAVGKGLEGDACLYVATPTWSNLNSDLNALRTIDSSYSMEKTDHGTKSIAYHSQNGVIVVKPHTMIKEGEAVLFPTMAGALGRYGSTDLTFELPDHGGEFFRHLTSGAGVEIRAYSDQLLINHCPAKCARFTGIVNS